MRLRIPLCFCTALLTPAIASSQTPPLFQVKGYGIHVGDEVVYRYRVINNSPTNVTKPAVAVQIEVGRASLDGEPELTGLLPASYPPVYHDGVREVTAPTGWKGVVSGEEEHVRHTLWWKTTEMSSPHALFPGQTLTGLSVRRSNINPTYLDSHFFIIANGSPRKFSGLVEREDTTPPSLMVSISPTNLWPPNEKLIPVTVTLTVKDDYDPQPEIKLESITANEPLEKEDIKDSQIGTDDRQFKLKAEREGKNKAGRIYTVTYSATDGTGNKVIASATVVVPHDERKKDD